MSITNFKIQSKPRFSKYRSLRNKRSSRSRCCSIQSLKMRSVVNKANTCYNDNCDKTIRGVNKMFVKTIKQNDVTSIIFPKELNVPVGADFKISFTEDQNIILQPVAFDIPSDNCRDVQRILQIPSPEIVYSHANVIHDLDVDEDLPF